GAQTAWAVLPCVLREKGNEINIKRARTIDEYIQPRLCTALLWMQHAGRLFPLSSKVFELHCVEECAVAGIDFNAQRRRAGDIPDLHGEGVRFALPYPHPAKAFVGDTKQVLPFRFDPQVVGVGGVEWIFVPYGYLSARLAR